MVTLLRSIITVCLLLLCSVAAWAQPTANFTSNTITGCAPLLVQFTDASTGGPTSWSWNFGNSATSVLQNPSTTYTAAGTYTVTLTATNASGSNTKTVTNYITVLGSPVVNFTANDTAGCPEHMVQFTNTTNLITPGAGTWNWSFGDGTSDVTENPSHNFPAPGYYNITLIATNSGGCTKSLTKTSYIHVYTPPVADFTSNAVSFCLAPATVNFTPTPVGTGPYTYSWNYGDGSNGSSNSHTYNTPGNFTVTMVVTDANGCKDTIIKPSFINIGAPDAAFTGPTSGCPFQTLSFTNTSVGGGIASWDFGDGTTVSGTNAAHFWSAPGTYNLKLKMTSGACADSIIQLITINPTPVPNFTFSPDPPCPAPQTIAFTNTTTGGNSYLWYFDDGGSSTLANPTHTYTADQNFIVHLIATNNFGCSDTLLKPINIYPMDLDAGASPYSGCVPLEVDFGNALYTTIPSGVLYPYDVSTYSWNFGDGTTSADSAPTHTYTVAGTYNVTLTITTVNGCTDQDNFQIHVGTKPNPSFTASPLISCVDEPIIFTNTSTNATIYLWDFGDGGTSTSVNPTYNYQITDTYTVTLTAYNNGCDSSYTLPTPIIILPPTSQMNLPQVNCANPLEVTFTDASIGADSRIWYFGDGTSSTALNPVHTYPTLGAYNLSLVTFNNTTGCSDTLLKPLTLVNPTPVFVADDTAICKPDTVRFQAAYLNGTATDYTWKVGNTYYLDSTAHLTHYFPDTGQYDVTVWIRDVNGCWDSLLKPKYILVAKPDAQFSAAPLLGCAPMLVTFTDQSTDVGPAVITSRQWTFGNGNSSTVTTPTTTQTYNAGIFDITLIVTDNVGCKDTITKNDYIEARKPHAIFTANDTTTCIGQNITFNNNSSGTALTHSWDFGDGTSSTIAQAVHAYAITGNFTVRLIVTDASGCKDTMTRTNYIDITRPDAAFTTNDTLGICPPLHTFFTNTSLNATSYAWVFGDGNSSILSNPDNVYSAAGLYQPMLIATDVNGCKDTATAQTVNVLGYAGGLSYTPLQGCVPLEVTFTATLSNVPSIVWDFSDGVTEPANGNSTTHTYVTPGAYIPKLILSDGAGCLNSSDGIDTIKVDAVIADFSVTPPCEQTVIQFADASQTFFSPITAWEWAFTNGTPATSSVSNPTQYYPAAGNYNVSLITTNGNGCKDTVDKSVTIFPLPLIEAFGDTVICSGDAATLNAQGGVSYTWAPTATVDNPAAQNPKASPTSPTSYVVTGTDINGCQNRDSVQVDIQFKTTFISANGGAICDDSTFQLSASGAQQYLWSPSETLNDATIAEPLASPHSTTNYLVIAKEGSCIPDSNIVSVVVYPKPTIDAGADVTMIAGSSVILVVTATNTERFKWAPAESLTCDDCSNPTAAPLSTTAYTVIGYTRQGCRDSDIVVVRVLCDQSQLFIPNTFTPNGDGQNDNFYPHGEGLKNIRSFRVYNRWGEVVYEQTNMSLNDKSVGWDGTYKGTLLNPDTYVYVLEGTCDSGEPINWKGDITLIR